MLEGSLRETQYDWPDSNLVNGGHRSPLRPKKETVISRDDVTYITDSVSVPQSRQHTRYADDWRSTAYTKSRIPIQQSMLCHCIVSFLPYRRIQNQAKSSKVYAPPNAAREGCQVFDEHTGEATHVVRYDLFSEMGRINDPKKTSR